MSETRAALTPEEWAVWAHVIPKFTELMDVGRAIHDHGAHGTAALCLHGQPFGFTPLMAYSIRQLAEHARKTAANVGPMHALWDSILDAEAAADRIEALLPPTDTGA